MYILDTGLNDGNIVLADMKGLDPELNHKTFLEELVFWTVKFEFPQKFVTLLLSLLPDNQYKVNYSTTQANTFIDQTHFLI